MGPDGTRPLEVAVGLPEQRLRLLRHARGVGALGYKDPVPRRGLDDVQHMGKLANHGDAPGGPRPGTAPGGPARGGTPAPGAADADGGPRRGRRGPAGSPRGGGRGSRTDPPAPEGAMAAVPSRGA